MNNNLLFEFSIDKENRTIHIKREFDADLDLLWQAWTTSELLDQWWGPQPWRAETKTMDFKEGGFWLYAMVSPEGEKHWSKATYIAIINKKSFTQRDGFSDENGVMNSDFPQNLTKTSFSQKGNKVLVEMLMVFEELTDLETTIEMGFEEGMTTDLNQLDELLVKIK